MRISDWSSDVCSSDLLFMQHGVVGDRMLEIGALLAVRQFAVQQQVAGLEEGRLLGQVGNVVAAIEQHAFIAVDVGDLALGAGGRGETRVVGEIRSEERRVGKECVSTCRYRWSPD